MDMIFVYVTASNEKESKNIVKTLIDKKLIACANFFPTKSIYKWEGNLKEEGEYTLILKTKESLFSKVKDEIEKIHSYEVPCITRIDTFPNEKYLVWLREQLI